MLCVDIPMCQINFLREIFHHIVARPSLSVFPFETLLGGCVDFGDHLISRDKSSFSKFLFGLLIFYQFLEVPHVRVYSVHVCVALALELKIIGVILVKN